MHPCSRAFVPSSASSKAAGGRITLGWVGLGCSRDVRAVLWTPVHGPLPRDDECRSVPTRWAPSVCCSTIYYRSLRPSFITEAGRGLAGNGAALLASSRPAARGDMSLLQQKVHPSEPPGAYLLSLCELPAQQSQAGAGDSPSQGTELLLLWVPCLFPLYSPLFAPFPRLFPAAEAHCTHAMH